MRWKADDKPPKPDLPRGPALGFSRALDDAFDPASQARGRSYEVQGRVTFVGSAGTRRDASVLGTRVYRVRIALESTTLFVECTCPVGPFCKHTWAALLAVTRRGDDLRLDLQAVARVRAGPEADASEPTVAADGAAARGERLVAVSPRPPAWRDRLDRALAEPRGSAFPLAGGVVLEARFVLDPAECLRARAIVLHAWSRPTARGPMARWSRVAVGGYVLHTTELGAFDRSTLALLGTRPVGRGHMHSAGEVPSAVALDLVRRLADRGQLALAPVPGEVDPAACVAARFDDGPPWLVAPTVREEADGSLVVDVELVRSDERVALEASYALLQSGLVVRDDTIARYETSGPSGLVDAVRAGGPVRIPPTDREAFARTVLETQSLAGLVLPASLGVTDCVLEPSYVAEISERTDDGYAWVAPWVEIDGVRAPLLPLAPAIIDFPERRRLLRDGARDAAARDLLHALGCLDASLGSSDDLPLSQSRTPSLVRGLLDAGWAVYVEGRKQRRAGRFALHAASGIDWLGLRGGFEFDGITASLPELLRAARTNGMVRLDDGSVGVVPDEWLARWKSLAGFGPVLGETDVRFLRSQVSLVDALLAAQPEATCDETFARLRQELRAFRTPAPVDPPASLLGTLRPYQRQGLGWLAWLGRLGLGGCLADDMGLGKTVQVLAYLLHRQELDPRRGPSLVVAPRSVVDHWVSEVERFAPHLRVVAQIGTGRTADRAALARADLLVTSYATLRRDVALLADVELDCLVLDEAQALKNPDAATTKAARVLRARQRIALSGTPIENHLGELWSIFDVVSPGMLGSVKVLRDLADRSDESSVETAEAVARAVRPFLLRRRKREVATDLPERTEETLVCTLTPTERALYDDLARHYRDALLGRVRRDGIKRAAFHVLEALLRLRQAACHPGLLDPKRRTRGSAKLDVLFEQLDTLADADADDPHKVLVFSQFTSLLDLVEPGLRERGVVFERLDGRTTDRAARVARFQDDPEVRVFLLSLKAGGTGLNLMAADYVYLLDPWWNPAVETQAIDRAHRIGQRRPVVAYRLIAAATIEERVAELQGRKRALADAILESDTGTRALADLTVADLERLLA
ncbi:MAG: DEAD/DEAH box helicase [Deltaproteobacteria bacterium]|nr:DEAD/DEAH box helicase [Deltaproteobacteria bacterium]